MCIMLLQPLQFEHSEGDFQLSISITILMNAWVHVINACITKTDIAMADQCQLQYLTVLSTCNPTPQSIDRPNRAAPNINTTHLSTIRGLN